jgi:hypothetical protein
MPSWRTPIRITKRSGVSGDIRAAKGLDRERPIQRDPERAVEAAWRKGGASSA